MKPDTHVPPVIEKVPPAVPTFAIVGAAVSVSGPAFAPVAVLVNVITPFFVVRVPGVVVMDAGPLIPTVAPTTLNGSVLLVPPGVVTPMLITPSVAAFVMLRRAVTLVAVEVRLPATKLTPPPSPVSPVAPDRFEPVRVSRRLVLPREPVPEAGEEMPVSTGAGVIGVCISTAPASTALPETFRGLPKKSLAGATG
jgi:hypothetical protein